MTVRTEVGGDKFAMTIRTEVGGDKACYDDTYGGRRRYSLL